MQAATVIRSCPVCGPQVESYADLLVGLRGAPERPALAVRSLDPTLAKRPGEWTVAQVLYHMADGELVWGLRLRLILAGDEPEIAAVPAEVWPDRLGYASADPREALALFQALREANVSLLVRVPRAEWRRSGRHAEFGRITVAELAEHLGHHDLHHLRDLEAQRDRLDQPALDSRRQ